MTSRSTTPHDVSPLIVTRGDGVPLPDQAAALEEFKRQAIRKNPLSDAELRATEEGSRMARKFFQKRGNHSEVHLSEVELAILLTVVYQIARGE